MERRGKLPLTGMLQRSFQFGWSDILKERTAVVVEPRIQRLAVARMIIPRQKHDSVPRQPYLLPLTYLWMIDPP